MRRIQLLLAFAFLLSLNIREASAQERGWGETWRQPGSAGERSRQERSAQIVRELRAKDFAAAEKNVAAFVRQSPEDPSAWVWSARVHALMHRFDAALHDCGEAIRLLKEQTPAALGEGFAARADIYYLMGNAAASRADRERALRTNRKNANFNNALAWLLATSLNPAVRDGAQAVRYARAANELSGGRDPEMLDTLAAAEAEAGDFEGAARDEREALALAKGKNLRGGEKRLRLYENHQAYREEKPNETISAE
jgi:tetratricopeptide (TPR) repeat protein